MSRDYDLRQYADVSTINTLNLLFDKYPFVLIVEGTTDKRIYSVLFQQLDELFVYSAKGKEPTRKMLSTLLPQYVSRCRAIIDRDYDFFTGQKVGSAQIVYTDAHSLETQLWMTDNGSTMLPKIINELIDYNTIYSTKQKMSHIYSQAYDTAYIIGLVRLADTQKHWSIPFKDYVLRNEFFDPQSEKLNLKRFLACFSNLCDDSETIEDIIDFVKKLEIKQYSRWEIMHGHDISHAFIYFIKKECTFYPPDWAGWDEPQKARDDFESRTRQACNIDNLKTSPFYQSIIDWIGASN